MRSEDKVNRAAEFVWDQVANCARTIAGIAGSDDRGTTNLLPFEHQIRTRASVQPPMPPDRHVALLGRERAVLCGVGGELMEHYCHCLTGFRAQYDLGAADSGIVVCGIGCKLVPNKLCQRYPLPATGAQKLLCCCHRANASVKRRYEIGHRSTTNCRLGDDGADGREGVLHAMLELRNQHALAFFSTFAFRYVDVDTNHALRTPVFIIR